MFVGTSPGETSTLKMEHKPMWYQRWRRSKKSIEVAEWLPRIVWLGYCDKTDSKISFLWFQQLFIYSLHMALLTISMSFDLSFSVSLKALRKPLFKKDQILLVRAELHPVDRADLAVAL